MRWFSRRTSFPCPSLSASSHLFPVACFHDITSRSTSRLNFILASEGFLLFSSPPHFSSSRRSMCYLKEASLLFCCLYITAPSDRHLSEPPGWEVGEFGHHKRKLGETSLLADDDVLTAISYKITTTHWQIHIIGFGSMQTTCSCCCFFFPLLQQRAHSFRRHRTVCTLVLVHWTLLAMLKETGGGGEQSSQHFKSQRLVDRLRVEQLSCSVKQNDEQTQCLELKSNTAAAFVSTFEGSCCKHAAGSTAPSHLSKRCERFIAPFGQ